TAKKTTKSHRQPSHLDKTRRRFNATTFAASAGVSVGVGFMQRHAATVGEVCHPVAGSTAGAPSRSTFGAVTAALAPQPRRYRAYARSITAARGGTSCPDIPDVGRRGRAGGQLGRLPPIGAQ